MADELGDKPPRIEFERIRSIREKQREKLDKEPSEVLISSTVEVNLIKNFHNEARIRDFVIQGDEPIEAGGSNLAPRPTEYFFAGFGFCMSSFFTHYSVMMKIPIESLRVRITGYLDRKTWWALSQESSKYKKIDCTVWIESKEDEHSVARLVREVQLRNPILGTLKAAVPVSELYYLNGKALPEQT